MLQKDRGRIILATDSAAPSGVGEHMLALGVELAHSFDVILALPVGAAGQRFLDRAARYGLGIKVLGDDDAATAAWLAAAAPSVFHVHAGIGWEGHGLIRAGRQAGVAMVRTEHLPQMITDLDQRQAYAEAVDLADRVIVVSQAAAETFRAHGDGNDRLRVVLNGILEPRPSRPRRETRASLGLGNDGCLLLCVARLTPQKGHATLLQAFARLDRAPGDALVVAGDGPEREELAALAEQLGLSERLLFLGERSDIPDLLAAADILVSPSLFEGLPLSVLEAMALGVPVVATRVGGTSEALGPDHAWYAAPSDPAELAGVLAEAMSDAVAARRIGEAGRRRFEAMFRASRMAAQTADIYAELLERPVVRIGKAKMAGKTKIGFIGAGGIAQRHLGVLEGFDDVELVAFGDVDFGAATASAGRFGARAYASHVEMLENEKFDAAYVCIPPFAHGPVERELLKRGIPFFVEKPLSTDLALAESISREVRRKNLLTAVGYHWRYLDVVDEARRLLEDNPAHLFSGYWLDQTPPPRWWWRNDRSGGQMVEQATHIIDLARYLGGDITQVFGLSAHRQRNDFPGLDVPTASTASLRFASGAIGNIGATCLLRWGHKIGLDIFADGLAIELTDREIMVDVGAGRPVRHAEGDPVWREDRDFIDAVRGGENRIRCTYADALETHRVALAIARSAESGMPTTFADPTAEAVNG